MKTIPLVVAVIAALAAAAFGWQSHQELGEVRASLAQSGEQLQKAQADLRSLTAEVAPLRKQAAELKMAFEQQAAELSAAKAFLETERTTTARVREELAQAKEQMAFMSRSRSAQQASPTLSPMMIRPATPPPVIAAPGSAPAAQGQAVRAR